MAGDVIIRVNTRREVVIEFERHGFWVTFTPEQARQLSVWLYGASEEATGAAPVRGGAGRPRGSIGRHSESRFR